MQKFVRQKIKPSGKPNGNPRRVPPSNNTPLGLAAPLEWLRSGLEDIYQSAFFTAIYGLCFVLMGRVINQAHEANPGMAIGLAAGFLFTGPFLAIGIYEVSRQRLNGEPLDPLLSFFSWSRNSLAIGQYALILSAIMAVWLWMSMRLISSIDDPVSVLRLLLLAVWVVLAMIVFSISVISIPMMLDQTCTALQAIRASVLVCFQNINAMAFWALLVLVLVGSSLWLSYWPLLVVGPWLGHATWHAYLATKTTVH